MVSLIGQKVVFYVSGGPLAGQTVELASRMTAAGIDLSVVAPAAAQEWFSLRHLQLVGAVGVAEQWRAPSADELVVIQSGAAGGEGSDDLPPALELSADAPNCRGVIVLTEKGGRGISLPAVAVDRQLIIESSQSVELLPVVESTALLSGLAKLLTPPRLAGVKVMVTAGPTLEDIDPVRFIGNRSSGKMGYAVATAAWQAGAQVQLISGPVNLPAPFGVTVQRVRSAEEMQQAVEADIAGQDIYISTAAVADFRPHVPSDRKIKKSGAGLAINLTVNPDILRSVAGRSTPPFCVGFAAETDQVENYARGKLRDKNLQMVAANLVGGEQGGFESDQNSLHLFWHGGERLLPFTGKEQLAVSLIEAVAERYRQWRRS